MMEFWKKWGAWVERGIFIVVVVLVASAWNRASDSEAALSKELERQRLEKEGLLVAHEATTKELKDMEQKLLMENAYLENQVASLTAELGKKPKIVEVIRWRTKVVPVEVSEQTGPRPCPQPDATGRTSNILLVEGDTGHVEVGEITYETKEGNHVIVASAACWRDTPSELRLFQSAIEAPISIALEIPEPVKKKWGGGVFVGSADGFSIGPALAFPPLEVGKGQFEFNIGVGFGTRTQASGTAIYRR